MRRIYILMVILLTANAALAQNDSAIVKNAIDGLAQSVEEEVIIDKNHAAQLWDAANTRYVNGDYAAALVLYDSITTAGYASGKLYYNIGNAFFKAGILGRAILYYNRALRLAPNDSDVKYNLSVAMARTKDSIDALPEFAVSARIAGQRAMLSSNGWAWLSLVLFAMVLSCMLVYLLARQARRRRAGFWCGAVALFFFVVTLWLAITERAACERPEAIVVVSATAVSSSPTVEGRELFIIHEGTKVSVSATYGDRAEVTLADGNKGWVAQSTIEMI